MYCPTCAHPNPDTAAFCAGCGNNLPAPGYMAGTAPPPYPGQPYGQQPPYGYPPPMYHNTQTKTSGLAIAGFVLSFFCGILGLIFSIIGYNECKSSNGMIEGQGLALAGIIISIVSMVLGLMITLAGA
jgi:hypothetical protein